MKEKSGLYAGMLPHEIEAAEKLKRSIPVCCHFSSAVIEQLIEMLKALEIR